MKKFVMGFLTAALLFTAIPIGAAIEEYICYKADYKVIVTGTEYISEDLPILNYKGSTYAPFRSVLEAAGLDVNWNAELRQAEVTVPKEDDKVIEYDSVTGLPIGATYTDMELQGKTYKAILYNGKTYISTADLEILFGVKATHLDVKSGIQNYAKGTSTVGVSVSSALFIGSYAYYEVTLFDNLIK